ncbi:MAG: acetyl-CoA carboxylase biotin carboxyl carrier protein [Bacteroidia bacterium]|nr:acetyl-CoA carboxylase biotin carboxyl carrier protein [Bacteroidia bacterium]
MNYKEIQDLLKFISKSELAEVRIKEGEFELTVRNKNYSKNKITSAPLMASPTVVSGIQAPAPQETPVAQTPAPAAKAPEAPKAEASDNLLEIRSPIVGTFYRSASPDKPPYVSVGDNVSVGGVVCIVEAMKLFNEIESEVEGKIVKVMVEDASPVEYDQVLYLVDPKG